MKSETVGPFKNGKATYELKVFQADAEMGMYRTMLQESAIAEENARKEQDTDLRSVSRRILHTLLYPAMVAASEPVKGFDEWPITFDEYRKLPEPLIIEWEEKVFTLNSHWQPQQQKTKAEIEEQEKKVPDSSPKS